MNDRTSQTDRIKHRNADFRDIQLEFRFVGGILHSLEAFYKVSTTFDPEALTSDKLKEVYEIALHIFNENNEKLSLLSLKNALNKPNNTLEKYITIYKKAKRRGKGLSTADIVTASERLSKMYKGRIVEIGFQNTISSLGMAIQGDLNKIDNVVNDIQSLSNRISQDKNTSFTVDPIDDFSRWKRNYKRIQKNPELLRCIPTGTPPIDKCMIGLRKAEFGVVVAETGLGKSIWLMDTLAYAWKTVGDVVIFTIEMPKEQYETRLYCNLSGIDYDRFRRYELTEEEFKRLDKTINKWKQHESKFHIIDMPEGCTAEAMKTEIEVLNRNSNVVIAGVDYMNIMGNEMGGFDMNWEFQVTTAIELKMKVARGLGLPLWSVAQSNDGNDMAFARHIKDQIDVGIMFYKSDDYEQTDMVGMSWLKTRDFKGMPALINTGRNKMKFYRNPEDNFVNTKKVKRKKKRLKV